MKKLIIAVIACFLIFSAYTVANADGLNAYAVSNEEFFIKAGDFATCEVDAIADEEVFFQWCRNIGGPGGEEIAGETGKQFSTNQAGDYFCRVSTVDDYDTIFFHVTVDNAFYAEAVGNQSYCLDPEQEIQLEVYASCNKGSLHYQWYIINYSGPGGREIIEGETDPCYYANQLKDYQCEVSDDYGNSDWVYFKADNQVKLEPADLSITEITVEKGCDVTLTVKATSRTNQFTYQWCIDNTGGKPFYLDGETSNTLTVKNIQQDTVYRCDIYDDNGHIYLIFYSVIALDGHTEVIDPAVQPTCTSTGLTEGKHCSECNKVLVKQETVPALGHDWDDGVVIRQLTETETGIREYTCRRCGVKTEEEFTENGPRLGKSGWVKNSNGTWSYGDSYGYAVIGIKTIDGVMYRFTKQGIMMSGWVKEDGKWYCAKSSGALYHNCWLKEKNTWYYFLADGEMATGWIKSDGAWYYMKADGAMATGWVKDQGKWFYLTSSGARKTGWLQEGKTWYYLKADGEMATGWVKEGGSWYYMKSSGAMATGWVQDQGNWYYFKTNGSMLTGWLKDGNSWYVLAQDGHMVTGWYQDGANWYYLSSSGAMKTGWLQLEDKWFYLGSDGAAKKGWQKIDKAWYWFDDDGVMKTGWLEEGDKKYWFGSSGAMATGWALVDGQWEMFSDSGVWQYTWDGK